MLLLVIGWVAFGCCARLRQGKFGSRLLIKLAAIFALVGVVPGVLVYVVSYQFVSRSIESWFDVKVEGALDAGLNLGRATLDTLSERPREQDARGQQRSWPTCPTPRAGLVLERMREQLGATDVVLWSRQRAAHRRRRAVALPAQPRTAHAAAAAPGARRSLPSRIIEGLDERPRPARRRRRPPASRRWRWCQRPGFEFNAEPRFLQVTQPLPPALVANALAVQEANREYQERALAREGLRRMYIGTLTLSLFLAVFGAVLLAVLFGNQLARPLLVLADGVRQVAAGDLRPTAVLQGKDELGGLTRSFADHDAAARRRARRRREDAWASSTPRAPTCRPSWTTSRPA